MPHHLMLKWFSTRVGQIHSIALLSNFGLAGLMVYFGDPLPEWLAIGLMVGFAVNFVLMVIYLGYVTIGAAREEGAGNILIGLVLIVVIGGGGFKALEWLSS